MDLIQETLESFTIDWLDISNCPSVVELLIEFKRIKTIRVRWHHSNYENDAIEEYRLKIWQFEQKLKKKHSEINIYIHC